jgi:HAD superfamily hydrolase (TIGR01509 family)
MRGDRAAVPDVLLLDYNGVVVDDEPIHFAVLRDLLAVERVVLDEAGYYAHFLGYDDRACIGEAFRRAGRPIEPEQIRTLAARKAAWYAEATRTGLPLVPGVQRFVREAAALLRIAIVSGALREEIRIGLAQAGIADVVGCIVSVEDVAHGKPDPEGHRLALAALAGGSMVARAVVVEDSRPGLGAARALGAGCVMLTTAYGGREAAGADLVWDSFEGHSPGELESVMREVAPAGHG